MWQNRSLVWLLLSNLMTLVISESYYTIIAPGVINANRKYIVAVSLHEADKPSTIRVHIDGPSYQATQEVYVRPYETKKLEFDVFKLSGKYYNLTAEGIRGFIFRNQSQISAYDTAGPKIYIQTDKAVYKPGDLVQFRVVMLDEHTKPLKIHEPIRVEILDGKGHRIKQFKDITLVKGVYTDKFQISRYPVMGKWDINVSISGEYDYSRSKSININNYVLPKFSVYIKGEKHFVPEDRVIRAEVYGKYTFDKYVVGNATARLLNKDVGLVLQEKRMPISNIANMEFRFDNPKDFEYISSLSLEVELEEQFTGITQIEVMSIDVHKQRYSISVDYNEIRYRGHKPFSIRVKVTHWNGSLVLDHTTPVTMKHGSKEYSAYLDGTSEATFEFEHEQEANHVFMFKDSTYRYPNIYTDELLTYGNDTPSYCRLTLKGERPRLGTILEIEVSSSADIPYLVYMIVGHGDIVRMEHIKVPPNQKTHTLQITPTIEMIPTSTIYVHYIQNGNLRYEEMLLNFPEEFENQISVVAPNEVRPGQEVTIELKAQRKAYVSILAVDLSVFLLDSSYDLKRYDILMDLRYDQTYVPFGALVYPGLLSGVVTLTNAHFPFKQADVYLPGTGQSHLPWKYRQKFPETWIFKNLEITDENTQLTLNIPDTITTWRITAFSVHEVTGFGIVNGPTDIVTIKPFFITFNLPYSVKMGEILSIPIIVFNYHNQGVDAEIIMYNAEQKFYFLESNMVETERGSEDQQRTQKIHVPANGIANMVFVINPRQVGEISLRITAENPLSSDAVIQMLRVEPEGVVQHGNKPLYISVPHGETFKTTLTADIPLNMVPDSAYVALSVGGDTLVPTLKNLNNLLLLPTGSGEQNMVNFAPNILVLEYLTAAKRIAIDKDLVEKANKFIEIGFQQQLSFRHNNGGYSVFGEKEDEEASTWLTAYTIRFFIKGEQYLNIEANIIESGLKFLADKQTNDGDFPFTGYLLQPAAQNRFGLTAFVLMAFLENEEYATKYQSTVKNGFDFLNKNLGTKAKDIYALSIMANAYLRAKHPNCQKILKRLRGQQIQTTGQRWWSENNMNREKDVEITAYILTAQLADSTRSDASDDLLVLKWLIEQRNALGGFRSTHDTVVGLQALVKFSEKYNDLMNINMQIRYAAKDNDSAVLERNELTVDANNVLILQTEELPNTTRSIDVEVTGSGFALLQLSYRYNMIDSNNFKHFQIQPEPKILNPDEMLLRICFSYQQCNDDTNMIIMEVNLPSGFTTSDQNSNDLLENQIIERIESKNSETALVIYFAKLSAGIRHCVNIWADKVHDVMERKAAAIIVYDYYNISRYDTAFYNV